MRGKLLRILVAFILCISSITVSYELKASEISARYERLSISSWEQVNDALIMAAENKIIVLDVEDLTDEARIISIPSQIRKLNIIGSPGKIYQNLGIELLPRAEEMELTISNLKIKGNNTGIDVSKNTAVTTIKFKGDNEITSTQGNGIAVYTGASLILKGENGDIDTLHIKAGEQAAGIGGRYYTPSDIKKGNGKITIESGCIEVMGGKEAAGIGGAPDANTKYEDIIIKGGIVKAVGGKGAAGIGAPYKQSTDCGSIKIEGGTVKAYGKEGGAGIGGGLAWNSGSVFNIEITGEKDETEVYAYGDRGGAGIGGGSQGHANNILINGGTIIARGSDNGSSKGGAAIGGGSERGFNRIQIGRDTIKKDNPYIKEAIAGSGAAAIGTGCEGMGTGNETIYLNTGVIDHIATIGGAAGIGGGYARGFKEVIVNHTRIGEVKSSGGGAAIGTGNIGAGTGNHITINPGSSFYVEADDYRVGDGTSKEISSLGGGNDREAGHATITIKGDVFMNNNKIGGNLIIEDDVIENYAFECYRVVGFREGENLRVPLNEGDFCIRKMDDPNIDLHPTTDERGRIYAYLESLGSERLSARGYYYQLNEGSRTFFASEFGRSREEGEGGRVLTVIKVEFIEGNAPSTTSIVGTPDGSKIIPFSYANIEVETKIQPGIADGIADEITDATIELSLTPLSTDSTFFKLNDYNKIICRGYRYNSGTGKYEEDTGITALLNGTNRRRYLKIVPGTQQIKLIYPSTIDLQEQYKIMFLIPCELKESQEVNTYYTEHVESSIVNECYKQVTATLSYKVSAYTIIDGVAVRGNRVLQTQTNTYGVRYWYLTAIH